MATSVRVSRRTSETWGCRRFLSTRWVQQRVAGAWNQCVFHLRNEKNVQPGAKDGNCLNGFGFFFPALRTLETFQSAAVMMNDASPSVDICPHNGCPGVAERSVAHCERDRIHICVIGEVNHFCLFQPVYTNRYLFACCVCVNHPLETNTLSVGSLFKIKKRDSLNHCHWKAPTTS